MYINSLTDIGNSREENQDNYWSAILNVNCKETGIVCVCDGMGGLTNGGIASSIVVKNVRGAILNGCSIDDLVDIVSQSNKTVNSLSKENKMGSTCTILYCCEGVYTILHVGDSRCYKLSKDSQGVLSKKCLTSDHSVIAEYGITPEKSMELYMKYKNSLTRAVGVEPTVTLDRYKGTYSDGDMFLVCSDGFWHYFDKVEELKVEDVNNLKNMVEKCMDYGEKDNITAVLLGV